MRRSNSAQATCRGRTYSAGGAFLCSRQALRPMIRRRWGRIVNVVSPAALLGQDGAANYAAAKAAC